MLNVDYNKLVFAEVKNVTGFFKEEAGANAMKVKSLYDSIKLTFGLNSLVMMVAQEADVYKYVILGQDVRKTVLGSIVYIPKDKRLDIWLPGDILPMLQFKGRSVVFKNYAALLDKLGLDRMFDKLIVNL